MLTVASVVGWYIDTYFDKKPCCDSILSGAAYANELLIGFLKCFRQICSMEWHVFMKLYDVICSKGIFVTQDITLEE